MEQKICNICSSATGKVESSRFFLVKGRKKSEIKALTLFSIIYIYICDFFFFVLFSFEVFFLSSFFPVLSYNFLVEKIHFSFSLVILDLCLMLLIVQLILNLCGCGAIFCSQWSGLNEAILFLTWSSLFKSHHIKSTAQQNFQAAAVHDCKLPQRTEASHKLWQISHKVLQIATKFMGKETGSDFSLPGENCCRGLTCRFSQKLKGKNIF